MAGRKWTTINKDEMFAELVEMGFTRDLEHENTLLHGWDGTQLYTHESLGLHGIFAKTVAKSSTEMTLFVWDQQVVVVKPNKTKKSLRGTTKQIVNAVQQALDWWDHGMI